MNDCRNDAVTLHSQFHVTLRNVFDTQAAHAVVQFQMSGKPVHKAKNLNLNALCELYGLPGNPLKESMKPIYKRDQRFWARRPLTREMILYAASDVACLVPGLYSTLLREMRPEFSQLFHELCDEQIYVLIKPEDVKLRKKQRKIETEVQDLKLKLSKQIQRNLVLSNREIRLLR